MGVASRARFVAWNSNLSLWVAGLFNGSVLTSPTATNGSWSGAVATGSASQLYDMVII